MPKISKYQSNTLYRKHINRQRTARWGGVAQLIKHIYFLLLLFLARKRFGFEAIQFYNSTMHLEYAKRILDIAAFTWVFNPKHESCRKSKFRNFCIWAEVDATIPMLEYSYNRKFQRKGEKSKIKERHHFSDKLISKGQCQKIARSIE